MEDKGKEHDDDLKEYDLEHYDSPVEGDGDGEGEAMGMFGNIRSLEYHQPGEEDPYITLKDVLFPSLLAVPSLFYFFYFYFFSSYFWEANGLLVR